jgi:hypothetical protein
MNDLDHLALDPLLAVLDTYTPRLVLPRALGVEHREVAHSRLLATLVDPRQHRQASKVLTSILEHVIGSLQESYSKLAGEIREIGQSAWNRVEVHRELFRVDLVVVINASPGQIVLGIENKIKATERPRQLADYQKALLRAFPDARRVLLLLTPTGRRPSTADPTSPVPCVAMGYDVVKAALKEASWEADDVDAAALLHLCVHIQEDIMAEPEIREIVRKLWRAHPRAMQLAILHRPNIADIRDRYRALLSERLPDAVQFTEYPGRGNLREIKMMFANWANIGFPFTFMFHTDEAGMAYVRTLIHEHAFAQHRDALTAWARRVNATEGHLLDEQFSPLARWPVWRRILREEDYPDSARLESSAFDDTTADLAAEAILRLVHLLRPLVEKFA